MNEILKQSQPEAPTPRHTPASAFSVGSLAVVLFLAALLSLSYMVLRDFLVPLVWSAILVYISWPLHQRLSRRLGKRVNVTALLMTLLLATAIVIPVIGITAMLGDELADVYRAAQSRLAAGPLTLPQSLADIPWLGERLQALVKRSSSDPAVIHAWLTEQGPQWLDEVRQILASIGRNTFKLGISLLALFFLYRDGERLITETRAVLQHFLGTRVETYWSAVTVTTQGVVYGLVLTALAQGVLAGLGYWVAGIGTAVLLGTLTALLALVPFGAPAVWAPTGLWLLATGEVWAGAGLLVWGALIVSLVDNIIRPLAISNTARIPFFLVLLGVLGGLRAFGLVGLFLGPIVLTVMLAVWREWLDERLHGATDETETGSNTG